jgi:hypothetical protein
MYRICSPDYRETSRFQAVSCERLRRLISLATLCETCGFCRCFQRISDAGFRAFPKLNVAGSIPVARFEKGPSQRGKGLSSWTLRREDNLEDRHWR